MNNKDDLVFDPNERVVPHGVTSHRAPQRPDRPVQSQATTGNARQVQPVRRAPDPNRKQMQFTEGPPVTRPVDYTPHPSRVPQKPLHQQQEIDEQHDEVEAHVLANVSAPGYVPTAIEERKEKVLDSRFEDVYLPSGCISYQVSQVAVRRFTIEELRSVIRARVSGNLRHLARAIDNTISVSVYDLTLGDLWWLMYWHRLNSYKKTPFIIDWTCNDKKHLEEIKDNKREPKSLRNLTTVRQGDLKIVEIDAEKYRAVQARILADYDIHVTPQTVADFLTDNEEEEQLELRRKKAISDESDKNKDEDEVAVFLKAMEDVSEDEERSFVNRYATLLSTVHGVSLKERIDFINTKEPDLLMDLEEFLEVSDHGVNENFTVKCTGCGASREIKQSLDALSFLPSLQRGGHS